MQGKGHTKEDNNHSSILAWETPGTKEPGRLQSMESQSVGHHLMTIQQQHNLKHYFHPFVIFLRASACLGSLWLSIFDKATCSPCISKRKEYLNLSRKTLFLKKRLAYVFETFNENIMVLLVAYSKIQIFKWF